jgi:Sigma-70 region 2
MNTPIVMETRRAGHLRLGFAPAFGSAAAHAPAARRPARESTRTPEHVLDPQTLGDHFDRLFRAAWALCGSRQDAEDLVQDTYARFLARPRIVRNDDDLGYLLRALRNTFMSERRASARRPRAAGVAPEALDLPDPRTGAAEPPVAAEAREVFAAIAALPAAFRDALGHRRRRPLLPRGRQGSACARGDAHQPPVQGPQPGRAIALPRIVRRATPRTSGRPAWRPGRAAWHPSQIGRGPGRPGHSRPRSAPGHRAGPRWNCAVASCSGEGPVASTTHSAPARARARPSAVTTSTPPERD